MSTYAPPTFISMQTTLMPATLNDLDLQETAAFKAYCSHEHYVYRLVLPPFLLGVVGDDAHCLFGI